jgi:hypothetical protein
MDPVSPKNLRAIAFSIKRDEGLKRVVVGDTEEILR